MKSISAATLLILAGCHLVGGIAPLHRAVEKVPNSYIIKIKDGYDLDELAHLLESHVAMRQSRGRLVHRYRRSFRGLSANLPTKEVVEMVQNLEAVEYVAENGVIHVTSLSSSGASQVTSSKIPWNLDRIDQAELPLNGQYNAPNGGKGVTVYVLDSGILPTHTEFGQRARVGFDALGGNGIDCTGHGTHVAAIAAGATYGVASEANVCGVRVVGAECLTNGTVADVVAGVDWVAHEAIKPAVATLSLNTYGEQIPLSHALDGLIEVAGITVVVAAGNMDDDACDSSPSSNEQVITVGATTIEDTRWASSNWGPCVDIFAPGEDIKSATSTGPKDTLLLSGTSEACPHVAGAAAILLAENPSLTHADVKAKILGSATPDVLLFNQASTTDIIEATANLMLCVQNDKPSAKPNDDPLPVKSQDINTEKAIPRTVYPNVIQI